MGGLVGVALALGVLSACGSERETLVVSAASSLTDAFTELAAAFEAERGGVQVLLNTGASSALAAQIAEGAPAGVFASANVAQMEVALAEGRGDVWQVFALNRLVVVAPARSEAVRAFDDLAAAGVRLVLAGADVPVGDYARSAIAVADAERPGFAADVLANVTSEEANVRSVLAKVELGEADAGIVYETDAATAGEAVRVVPVPQAYAPSVRYPIAALGRDEAGHAAAFVAFVLAEDGQRILGAYGFTPASGAVGASGAVEAGR
ncbi:MAG: molybdate ABC transporter substrate-binding protein [Dehalococcoidia bacterium]|nr:molybdate ABC transporter substrate-binding protein [Dehalococcoidia bacterium]